MSRTNTTACTRRSFVAGSAATAALASVAPVAALAEEAAEALPPQRLPTVGSPRPPLPGRPLPSPLRRTRSLMAAPSTSSSSVAARLAPGLPSTPPRTV